MSLKITNKKTGEVIEKYKGLIVHKGRQHDIRLGSDFYGWQDWIEYWDRDFGIKREMGPSWPYNMSGGPDEEWTVDLDLRDELQAELKKFLLCKRRESMYQDQKNRLDRLYQESLEKHNEIKVGRTFNVIRTGEKVTCFWHGEKRGGFSSSMKTENGKYIDALWLKAKEVERATPFPSFGEDEMEDFLNSPQWFGSHFGKLFFVPQAIAMVQVDFEEEGLEGMPTIALYHAYKYRDTLCPARTELPLRARESFFRTAHQWSKWVSEERLLHMFFDGSIPFEKLKQ